MRKRILLVLLAAAILFSFSCEAGGGKSFLEVIPENTKFFVEFKSFQSVAGIIQPLIGEKSSFIKAFIGFDPFSKEELVKLGLDPAKPFGLFFTELDFSKMEENGKPSLVMAFAIPTTSGNDLIKNIESKIAEKSPGFQFKEEDGIYSVPIPGSAAMMKPLPGYLYIAAGEVSKLKDLLSSIGQSSIKTSAVYQKLSAAVGDTGSVTMYADYEDGEFFSKLFSSLEKFNKNSKDMKFNWQQWLKGYKGFKVSVDFNSPNFKINSAALFDKNAPINELQKSVTYDKTPLLAVDKNPALIFSFGLNLSKYTDMLFKTMESEKISAEADAGLAKVKEMTGLDIKNDIINNLGGNINFGIYDLSELKTMKFNGLLSISLKDSKKIVESLKILKGFAVKSEKFNLAEETIQDTQTFVAEIGPAKIYVGIKNSLIISSDLDVYTQALSGTIDSGFVPKLKDSSLQKTIKNSDFFYLDLSEFLIGAKSATALLGDKGSGNPLLANLDGILKVMENFEYLLVSSNTKGELKTGTFMIKTKFNESFFAGIARTIKEIQKLEKTTTQKETNI